MPHPRYCRNPDCAYCYNPPANWCVRNGTYSTLAHGRVQRFECRRCRKGLSGQTESMHYYAKRRLELKRIFSRIRAGSSMRDIGRELGCSRTAVANAVVRLGRQAMAAHIDGMCDLKSSGLLCFDGLVSSLAGRDYWSQIHTLGDRSTELILAMTHSVSERGGVRSTTQQARLKRKRAIWRSRPGALTDSISLLVSELSRFVRPGRLLIDTDQHPAYRPIIERDTSLRWYARHRLLTVRQTSGTAPRTVNNPLFLMNYIDRMIRHRIKEHARESIVFGRNATMQMLRMWIFAWDHNCCQPRRVALCTDRCRAEYAGVSRSSLGRLRREFYSRRLSLRRLPMPTSIRKVWTSSLDSPPLRSSIRDSCGKPLIAHYAQVDLNYACPHGP